jgi:hypothetical protein
MVQLCPALGTHQRAIQQSLLFNGSIFAKIIVEQTCRGTVASNVKCWGELLCQGPEARLDHRPMRRQFFRQNSRMQVGSMVAQPAQ